jgi:hypothetical protein
MFVEVLVVFTFRWPSTRRKLNVWYLLEMCCREEVIKWQADILSLLRLKVRYAVDVSFWHHPVAHLR